MYHIFFKVIGQILVYDVAVGEYYVYLIRLQWLIVVFKRGVNYNLPVLLEKKKRNNLQYAKQILLYKRLHLKCCRFIVHEKNVVLCKLFNDI